MVVQHRRPRTAQSQEDVPSSQGAFRSVGISGNKTNEKRELRLSPPEENLLAEPSGEHSTSQFKQELGIWPGMHLKSPLQTKKPTKPFGLLGLLTRSRSNATWTTQGAEPPPPPRATDHATSTPRSLHAVQTCQTRVPVSPEHPAGLFGKDELVQTRLGRAWPPLGARGRAGKSQRETAPRGSLSAWD